MPGSASYFVPYRATHVARIQVLANLRDGVPFDRQAPTYPVDEFLRVISCARRACRRVVHHRRDPVMTGLGRHADVTGSRIAHGLLPFLHNNGSHSRDASATISHRSRPQRVYAR